MIGFKASLALSAVVIALAGAAIFTKGRSAAHAEREPNTIGMAQTGPVRDVSRQPYSETSEPALPSVALADPADTIDPTQGLIVTQQRFRRGGLGSKVMTSFTLVNSNEFAVKDVAMRCEFAGRDGRYVSSRQRVMAETVQKKSRKRVGPALVGYVNVTLSQARCAIASASRA